MTSDALGAFLVLEDDTRGQRQSRAQRTGLACVFIPIIAGCQHGGPEKLSECSRYFWVLKAPSIVVPWALRVELPTDLTENSQA